MNKILVTGGKGFVGKHVVTQLFRKGYGIRTYDLVDGYDLLDQVQLEEVFTEFTPNIVIHLGAQVFLGPSLTDPEQDAATNVLGTINVLEEARKHDARVILSSSGAVYGSNDRSNIKESHIPEPVSPYGLSKLTAEKYCLLYNTLYDMKNVVFRFSSIYGMGRKKTSVNLIIDKAIHDEPIQVTGDGQQTRDFTHVTDVVQALVMAVEGKFPAGTYNIGTGHSTSLIQLIDIVEYTLKKPVSVQFIDKSVGDPLRNDFNVDKAEAHGYKAKVRLEEGIRTLVNQMKG